MGKILIFLNKWGIAIILIVSILVFMNTCGTKGELNRTNRRIDAIERKLNSIDSTISTKVSQEQNDIMLEIISLETSRRVVYDNNTVVRTTKRPDDIMNEYDQKIKDLQKKLESLRLKK